MSHSHWLSAAAATAVVTWAGTATARPPMVLSPQDSLHAQEWFQKGNVLLRTGKLEEARAQYVAVWALEESYRVAANLGHVEFTLGRYRDAAEHLAFALHHFPADKPGETRTALEEHLAQAKQYVGTLSLHLEPVSSVMVDGTVVEHDLSDGDEVFVEPGGHSVAVSKTGYLTTRKDLQVAKGETLYVDLTVAPSPSLVPASASAATDPQPVTGTRSWVPIVIGASAAGAGVILGTALTVAGNNQVAAATLQRDQILALPGVAGQAPCPGTVEPFVGRCATLRSTVVSADALANTATWAFIGAGAAAVGTGTYLLWPRRSAKPADSASVLVVPVPQGAIVVATGSF